MTTAAQAMVKCLEEEGVKVVFGYPGAAICPFYDALASSDIRHILVRQEQNGAHAANGYARMSGRPGVCIATSGPGATNLLTGIATAYSDSIPIVCITGQVSTELLGRDVFQEVDITGAVEPFVKHSYLVKKASDIPRVFKEAFHIAASGRPGPVLIDVPVDVQRVEFDYAYPESVNIRGYKPSVKGHVGQIKKVAAAIKEAKCPVICAGGGVIGSQSTEELVALAEKCNIPVITTMMGISTIPSKHPLYYGMLGMHGVRVANSAILDSDLLILIGARVSDRAVATPGVLEKRTKIIHIDVDPAEIGKNVGVSIPVVGDAKVILNQLNEIIEPAEHIDWIRKLDEIRAESVRPFEKREGSVNPKEFMTLLSESAPEETYVVADVGQNQIWTANYFQVKKGKFMTSGGMGTMGYSVPAAMGVQLASEGQPVVAVCGDGSFQMQMMELATMCQHDIPVKIVVLKNNRLGMVRELQTKGFGDRQTAVFLDGSPNFSILASAYGIPAQTIDSIDQAKDAFQEFFAAKTPYLLEVIVDKDEPTL
ncbi:acetolactate synthase, large subunit, biosynthetic type [[Clostridium] methylpentosum DSM 5476]|uniref:Acetolactate synthase n=1 Tax=[Clostridium] methylpentosum DSM 5476 TaxID=537013 RepID=C0EF01_9FIRM|nr:acetolactate synthase, large subunit, biosynthetic type [[Clostridium] methylpentosum DSM 5476]MDY3988570.1 biosynthetic-type acetolactate synthase large subunit [Massilioclostridium sp.]MEE1492389.1 biosynthetic-type acetolactate synthase large subunit [Massilioclostridium sp.]